MEIKLDTAEFGASLSLAALPEFNSTQKKRPESLLCVKESTLRPPTLLAAKSKGKSAEVTVNVTLPTPTLREKGGFSIAHVAYPFKNSADGKIEQFIHTPTTPSSDPRRPKGPYTCSLNSDVTESEGGRTPLSKLHLMSSSSKQFDLTKLMGPNSVTRKDSYVSNRSSSAMAPKKMPQMRKVEFLKKRRPSIMDLVLANKSPKSHEVSPKERKALTIKSIDAHSLKMFEW